MRNNKELKDYAIYLYSQGITETSAVVDAVYKKYGYDKGRESLYKTAWVWLSNLRKSDEHPALAEECSSVGIPFDSVKHGWYKGKHWSLAFNTADDISFEDKLENLRDGIISDLKSHTPVSASINRDEVSNGHMLFVGLTDVHLGAVGNLLEDGQDYNSSIAVKRCLEGVQGIIDKSKGFNIDKIYLLSGSDLFHSENMTMKTRKGTGPFLMSEAWFSTFRIARQLYVDIVEMLRQVAPVKVVFIPGNHDHSTGFMLTECCEAYYHNDPDIEFETGPAHRKYFQYGDNAIMVSHGDGGKEADLPLTFAHEAKKMWSETNHKYVYLGHKHHKIAKDYQGVSVEYLRSPKSSDEWHSMNQYKNAPQAIEGFIHHPENGQIARISHIFTSA
jgi:hypothetical protein